MTTEVSFAKQFLIAMPSLAEDQFAGTLIYVCEHSAKGALGLVINKPTDLTLANLLQKVDLTPADEPERCSDQQRVFYGGPVQTDRGFVLHTPTRAYNSSLSLGHDLALTTSRDILQDVAIGSAPTKMLVTLGYSGWGAGQLEEEMARNAWLNVPAHESILFEVLPEQRYLQALGLLGIDPIMLSGFAGHA